MQVLASQLPFLANRNAELAVPPLFWPDKCIKIGGHVALLSGPTVYTLYCAQTVKKDMSMYHHLTFVVVYDSVFTSFKDVQKSERTHSQSCEIYIEHESIH